MYFSNILRKEAMYFFVSPILNPLIPKEKLGDYIIPLSIAQSNHNRLVKRLRRAPPEISDLYHETFWGYLYRGEILPISIAEALESHGNWIIPVLVFKHQSISSKLRICWNLSLKNVNSKCWYRTAASANHCQPCLM